MGIDRHNSVQPESGRDIGGSAAKRWIFRRVPLGVFLMLRRLKYARSLLMFQLPRWLMIWPRLDTALSLDSAMSRCAYWSALLDRYLAIIGLEQNREKKQFIVRIFSKDSIKQLCHFYARARLQSGFQAKPVAKHLGAWHDILGNNSTEVHARQQSASSAWLSMGVAWTNFTSYSNHCLQAVCPQFHA